MALSIGIYRKRFYIVSGVSRLSRSFTTEEAAQTELDTKRSFYEYWGGSCGVSVQNTKPVIKNI